jgi:hypothetical protein
MTEYTEGSHTDEIRADEPAADQSRTSDRSTTYGTNPDPDTAGADLPQIPSEIVGNTTDIVSRDSTATAGETPEELVENEA